MVSKDSHTMDSLKIAATDLKGKVSGLIDELRSDERFAQIQKTITALHSLEDLIGEPRTQLEGIWANASAPAHRMTIQTRPDEFYGLEPLDAAKKVLKKIGRSAKFSE